MKTASLRRTAFIRIHWLARKAFERAGYHWETRRTGDVTLGLWRIGFRTKASSKNSHPRRLVVLPGFGDTPLSWLPILSLLRPVLARRFDEVVLMDFPGFHGFLRDEKCVSSMDLLVRSTSDALDSLKPEALLGHSLGGWLAAHYLTACGSGERPSGPRGESRTRAYEGPKDAFLIAPSGVFGSAEDRAAWRALFESALEEGFEPVRHRMFYHEPVWFRALASEFTRFFQREDTIEFMRSVREDHDVLSGLPTVRAKVWLVWGEEDGVTPSSWAQHWLDALPPGQGEAVILPGTGHSLQLERPGITGLVLAQILLGQRPHRVGSRWWKSPSAGSAASAAI